MSLSSRARDALVSYYYTRAWPRRMLTRLSGYEVIYQTTARGMDVRVVENRRLRRLRFNEFDNQSVLDLGRPERLVLPYMRHAVVGLACPARLGAVLHIGLGGGTMARFVHGHFADARQTAIEYFPEVVDVAYRFFGLPRDPRLEVVTDDGLAAVERSTARYDVAFADAFADDEASVAHLSTDRFVRAVQARLGERGWLVKNVLGEHHPERVVAQLADHFPMVGRVHVKATNQWVILAGGPAHRAEIAGRAALLAKRLPIDFSRLVAAIDWVKV